MLPAFHPEPAHVPHHTDANGRKFLPVARSSQHHAGPTVISVLVARARLACVSLLQLPFTFPQRHFTALRRGDRHGSCAATVLLDLIRQPPG
ncbi:MAG: hypothetical protein ACJ8AW_48060 [Rhodopila sp.]